MTIKRPMKAPSDPITDGQLHAIRYPIVGSPKLDGWRCTVDGEPRTSSMKPWPNEFIREALSDPMYQGLDGEILVGAPNDPKAFFNTDGPVKSRAGQPNFRFYVFDYWEGGDYSYQDRWLSALPEERGRIVVLQQRLLNTPEEVIAYEREMLQLGFEGAMIRSLDGLYKQGRCSFREMNVFKRKPFVECEAVIVGFVESMENLNEQKMNETGHMRRSHHQANMRPKGTLGSFVLKCDKWPGHELTAAPGEGYDMTWRQDVWNRRDEYLGKIATVKYQLYGSRDAPRIPSVTQIRDYFVL